MTKEEIIKGIINDLPIPSLRSEMISDEWYGWFEEALDKYATQIVLDKLPGDDEIEKEAARFYPKYAEGRIDGMKQMRTIATQRITTRDEVEKPYKDFLRGLKSMQLPLYVHNQINLLLKSPTGEK